MTLGFVQSVWFRLRAELRSSWRAGLVLGLVVGITAGMVLVLAVGARRTSTSYRRFLMAQDAADVQVSLPSESDGGGVDAAQIRSLPNVREVTVAGSFFVIEFGAGVGVVVPPDDRIGTAVNRFKMLEGRRPRADEPSGASDGLCRRSGLNLAGAH